MTLRTRAGRFADPGLIGRQIDTPCFLVAHRGHSRRAWVAANGAIPDDLLVLHHCDEPRCVRLDHLFIGTQTDNIQDAKAKGRHSPPPIHREHGPEWNAKVGLARRGVALSEAHRAALKEAWKTRSRVASPEARAKISAGLLGRPVSAETRARISAAKKGRSAQRV